MNIFEAKPDSTFVLACILTILTEIIILILQGRFGAIFFIPKRWRKNYYNYYQPISEIKKVKIDFESLYCSICLNPFITETENKIKSSLELENVNTNPNDGLIIKDDFNNRNIKPSSVRCNLTKCFNGKNKSELMMTPCKHVFHAGCLKIWNERKNECPICRKVIPNIED